jgi:cyclopropane-fatty-acyl-phospholipid synthase
MTSEIYGNLGVVVSEPVADKTARAMRALRDTRLRALPFTIRFWDGSTLPAATRNAPIVSVRSVEALGYLVREPNQLGLARAWVTGALEVDGDLEAVLAARERYRGVALSRRERLRLAFSLLRAAGLRVLRTPPAPAIEARVRGRRHSLARDRAVVRHHYDVSNEFYRLVLGPSMTYSCAYFDSPEDTLESAQERKHELICRKLRLQPGERLLDIGCGWGSLLLHAAARHRVRGVGVTLSEPQAELARGRIREAGLSDLVEIRVADYREVSDGPFEKVVSVGMYEHVGRSELDRYAQTVAGLLGEDGLFLNHGIARLQPGPPSPDTFISRYIFPDGELHPVTDIMDSMQRTGLEVRDVESLREHYPLTLRRWLSNLQARQAEATEHAGEERERAWRLYMLGSAQAFEAGEISVFQVLAARSGGSHGLPLNRAELLAQGELWRSGSPPRNQVAKVHED